MHPKFVTTGPHTIVHEIFTADPRVEHFTHIRPNSFEAALLRWGELALLAFVVATVELIHNEVFDCPKSFLDALVPVDVGFEVTGIIVDDRISLHLLQLHCCLYHCHFVRQAFIDLMLLCCQDLPGLWINDKLPASRPVLHGDPLAAFVGTCA